MGGWGTGATLVGSGIIAGVMVVYSYVHFRETRERHEEGPQLHP
jgi:hypothetical protein